MPLIDKPLAELRKYKGISPKPNDFEKYWEEALAEVKDYIPKYEIVKNNFKAPNAIIEDLYFDAIDNSRIHARIFRPVTSGKKPVVFSFHGYSGNVGNTVDKLQYVLAGGVVVALDTRGQGGQSNDSVIREGMGIKGYVVRGVMDKDPRKLYYRAAFLDIVTLVNLVKTFDYVDTDKLFARGASQGGALTVACAALCPDDIKAIAPSVPFLSDYKRIYEMDLMKAAYEEFNYYIQSYLPEESNREEFWNRLGYIDIQYLANRVKADTLWCTGLLDTICPPSTQFATYNKLNCKKDMKIYSNFGHEAPGCFFDDEFAFLTSKF